MEASTKHLIIRKEEMKWEAGVYDNTEMSYLWDEPETGRMAFLLKCAPGSSIPFHDHPRREVVILLEGEVRLNDDILRAGDFLTAGGQEAHDVYSENGCIFFIFIDYNINKHKFVLIDQEQVENA